MNRLKLIEARRSVREYKDRELSAEDMAMVEEYITNCQQLKGGSKVSLVNIPAVDNFCQHFAGKLGYNGVMIKAPHYVLLTAEKGSEAIKSAGYVGEAFVLELTKHDIGSCWLSANHHEQELVEYFAVPADYEVVALIAFGYPEVEAQISKIYQSEADKQNKSYSHFESEYNENAVSSRKSIEDIVYLARFGNNATVEKLEELGYDDVFYYMRLAPSSVNRQPWRFVISRGKFILAVSRDDGYDDDRVAELEAGIAMLYFEVAMHDSGYPGSWDFSEVDNSYQIPSEYFIAGSYHFN